jgi:hypothetical protein
LSPYSGLELTSSTCWIALAGIRSQFTVSPNASLIRTPFSYTAIPCEVPSTGDAANPRYRMSGWNGSAMLSFTLMLESRSFSAVVKLAVPSRVKASARTISTVPGILSISIDAPGIAVAVTTTARSNRPSAAWAMAPLGTAP